MYIYMQTTDWSNSVTSTRKWIPEGYSVVHFWKDYVKEKTQSCKIPACSSFVPARLPHVRPLGTPQCDCTQRRQRNYKPAALARLDWVSQTSLGKNLLGVQKRALRSALRAVGWSGPVDRTLQRIRTQGLVWKSGFHFRRECVHEEEKTQKPAYSTYLCTSSSFCRLLFHASEIPVLYKFHSILHDLKFLFGHLLVSIMQRNVGWLYVSHH